MFTIKRPDIDKMTKDSASKSILGKTSERLYNALKHQIWNVIDITSEFFVYEMGHFVNNMDRWLHNRQSDNKTKYKRGTIVYLDLGATNFRFEPSFTHPCIVLVNRYNMMLVVPCSSKKYGSGHSDIIDASTTDGFYKPTGVQVESFRWVHKNRVISIHGKVSGDLLNKIDQHILSLTPSYKKEKVKFEAQEQQLAAALAKISDLETHLSNLK